MGVLGRQMSQLFDASLHFGKRHAGVHLAEPDGLHVRRQVQEVEQVALRPRKAQMRKAVRLEGVLAVVLVFAVVGRNPCARMFVQCAHEPIHVAEQAVKGLHRTPRPLRHRSRAQRRFPLFAHDGKRRIEHPLPVNPLLRHGCLLYNIRYITYVI